MGSLDDRLVRRELEAGYRVGRVTDPAVAGGLREVLAAARDPDVDGLVKSTVRSIRGSRVGLPGEWAVWAAVTVDGGEVVGMAEAWDRCTSSIKGGSGRPVPTADLVDGPCAGLGTLTRIVVAPAHRRRGIGRMLTEARLGWLAGRGCSHVMTTATIPRGDDEAAQVVGVHARHGLATLDGFRRAEPTKGCRHCTGLESCACETVVMIGPIRQPNA